ncbi:MAG TPA: SHOCT domain-containing protein [Verrucomicrobiae bacterium]|jgi:putative membrane protein|nr:SHOCT domain-containing protein [Verrucomicrobiae bacterium]
MIQTAMLGKVIAMSPLVPLIQDRGYEWGWRMHSMWGIFGIGMMLMMLVFWVLVIVGLVAGIRWLTGQSKGLRSDSALEILRQRYARGEINKEEFETKKRDLGL